MRLSLVYVHGRNVILFWLLFLTRLDRDDREIRPTGDPYREKREMEEAAPGCDSKLVWFGIGVTGLHATSMLNVFRTN